jgi:hypothetical protein
VTSRKRETAVEAVGDVVSVGSAAIPFFGGPISALLQAVENRHLQAQIRMLQEITESLGTRIDDIEASAARSEELIDLAAHAVRVAPELRSDELIEGVANIVALAFVVSPPQIDRAHLLIDIAGRLSPEHLTVLRAVSRVLADSYERSDRNTAKAWPTRAVVELHPELEPVIEPLIGQLESFGAIRRVDTGTGVRAQSGPFESGWALSGFGVQLLNHLDGEL